MPLGHAWRTFEAPFYYLRGNKILHDYTRHYHRAQRVFRRGGEASQPVMVSARHVGVRDVVFGAQGNLISLPDNYLELVERVAENVNPHFSLSKDCSFFPGLPAGPIAERTENIPAINNGEVITIQLKNPLVIDGLEELCAPIMQQLERKVYGSYAIVDKVYIYRSVISRHIPRDSWLWHYDNHPHELLKLMIYLNDVSDESAPFEYLRCAKSLKPVPGSPLAPLYGHSRISEQILRRYLSNGFESHKVTGPRGTMILFDNNMVHRANLASHKYRDVLIFQVRPSTFSAQSYIDPRWTGSFQHASFNPDPNELTPSTRKLRYFYWNPISQYSSS
jgi:hypothetical protein